MKYLILVALAAPMLVSAQKTWKAAVLTDVHIDPHYQANVTAETYCELKPQGYNYTKDVAHLGRLGCDAPIELFERVLYKINQSEGNLDLLFMPGDFMGHTIPIEPRMPFDEAKYSQLFQIHWEISELLAKYLPNTLVIPAFGNNDWIFHY
jgi:hypothetical protein